MLKKLHYAHIQWIFIFCVLFVVAATLLPSLQNGIISYQDNDRIFQNFSIQSLTQEHVKSYFTSLSDQGYTPVFRLLSAIQFHFFGNNPFYYHLVNLLLHLLIIFGIYWLALRFSLNSFGAAMASLLFGIHPLHVQHVAWISSQQDLWAALFYIMGLSSYYRFLDSYKVSLAQTKRSKREKAIKLDQGALMSAAFWGILSALSVSWGISIFLVFLLLDWIEGRGFSVKFLKEKAILGIFFLVLTAVNIVSQLSLVTNGSWKQMLVDFPVKSLFSARQFFFPLAQIPFYRLEEFLTFGDSVYWGSVILLGLVFFVLIRYKEKKWIVFPVLFYFFSPMFFCPFFNPETSYFWGGNFYLSTMGLCFLFGYCLDMLTRNSGETRSILFSFFRYLAITVLLVGTVASIRISYQASQIWKEEKSVWEKQLKMDPQDANAIIHLVGILNEQSEYKQAIVELKTKITSDKKGSIDFTSSKTVTAAAEKVHRLISLYKQAIHLVPQGKEAQCRLADVYRQIGLYEKAKNLYAQVIENHPNDPEAYFGFADVYRRLGEVSNAIKVFDLLIKIDPENIDYYYSALDFCNDILRQDPENASCVKARERIFKQYVNLTNEKELKLEDYFNLGQIFQQVGDFERANAAYLKVLDKNPQHLMALYHLGGLYRQAGRLNEALGFYQKVVSLNSNMSDVYAKIASVYGLKNQKEKAIEYYQKAIEVNPREGKAYFDLGYIYETLGNLRKAINNYENALQYLPEEERIYYNLGNIYAKLDLKEKAAGYYEKVIALNPRYMDAYVNLSIIFFQLNRYQDAIKYCDLAVVLGYEPPEAYSKTLDAYRGKNN